MTGVANQTGDAAAERQGWQTLDKYCFQYGLIDGRWQSDVSVTVDDTGRISDVGSNDSGGTRINGYVLPGVPNVHSHAFQWTFAGQSELRTSQRDSFWTWRELMYESVSTLTPDAYYESARMLYQRMMAAGYTQVGEFHYIHNDPDGHPYPPPHIPQHPGGHLA